jgi:predicted phosphoribosyltransferase
MRYADRAAAAGVLADRLAAYAGAPDTLVLGLPRGGVPIAVAVAARLGLPVDVLVVRKLGVPDAPEVAFGALGPHGVRIVDEDVVKRLPPAEVDAVIARESAELRRRQLLYRPSPDPVAATTLIVDDGLATGATARAAVAVVRRLGATRVVVAVPVGPLRALARLDAVADEVVCPVVPARFVAVSRHYRDFTEVEDDAVLAALGR